jgi:hypothetical protein
LNLNAFNGGGTFPNDFFISGMGDPTDPNMVSDGALRLSRSDVIASGTIHLVSDANITLPPAQAFPAIHDPRSSRAKSPVALRSPCWVAGTRTRTCDSIIPRTTGPALTTFRFGEVIIGGNGDVIPNGLGKGNVFLTGTKLGST